MFAILFFVCLEKILPGLDDDEEDEAADEGGSRSERTPLLASASGRATPSLNDTLQSNGVPFNKMAPVSRVRITDCSSVAEADFLEEKLGDDPLFLGRVGLRVRMRKPLACTPALGNGVGITQAGQSIPNCDTAPHCFFSNSSQAKSGVEVCFAIGSRYLWCWGQSASRIQNKDARANSSISAMRSPYYPFLEERALLGVIDAAVVGAGGKTRLTFRI